MAFENKEGQGALFVNGKKQNTNQPDYTGNVKVNGKDMRIAAWVKEPKIEGKNKFLSIQISEPIPATGDPNGTDDPNAIQRAKVIV